MSIRFFAIFILSFAWAGSARHSCTTFSKSKDAASYPYTLVDAEPPVSVEDFHPDYNPDLDIVNIWDIRIGHPTLYVRNHAIDWKENELNPTGGFAVKRVLNVALLRGFVQVIRVGREKVEKILSLQNEDARISIYALNCILTNFAILRTIGIQPMHGARLDMATMFDDILRHPMYDIETQKPAQQHSYLVIGKRARKTPDYISGVVSRRYAEAAHRFISLLMTRTFGLDLIKRKALLSELADVSDKEVFILKTFLNLPSSDPRRYYAQAYMPLLDDVSRMLKKISARFETYLRENYKLSPLDFILLVEGGKSSINHEQSLHIARYLLKLIHEEFNDGALFNGVVEVNEYTLEPAMNAVRQMIRDATPQQAPNSSDAAKSEAN